MTLYEIEKRLEAAGCPDPKGESYLLAEHFCKIPKSLLVTRKNSSLECPELELAVSRREAREPLQYIIGEWFFMNECYEVNKNVLIPRPDTEILVEYGINNIAKNGIFADLCAGSGCVGISTLAARDDLFCISAELFEDTLEVAKRNAKRNKVAERTEFFKADVTVDFLPEDRLFDAVLANPPYVTLDEYESLEKEVKNEPRAALTDEGDGLFVIRKIIEIYPSHLKENGFIAIEIGASQGETLRTIAKEHGLTCQILKDYSGKDRVAVLKKH